jgi:branched-chain amino acid aminotransferase
MSECILDFFVADNQLVRSNSFKKYLFTEGTTLYEVIRVINGKCLFLEDHLMRLFQSAGLAGININLSKEEITQRLKMLIESNKINTGNIKILYNRNLPEAQFLAYFISHSYPAEEDYSQGVKLIFYKAMRVNPNAKVVNDTLRRNINQKILDAKAYEALLLNENNEITEGSRSNVFFIKGNRVVTPPVVEVLPGITRDHIIRVCQALSIPLEERKVKKNEIDTFDSVFLSGTSPKVLPVQFIEDVCFTVKNSLLRSIMHTFDSMIEDYLNTISI